MSSRNDTRREGIDRRRFLRTGASLISTAAGGAFGLPTLSFAAAGVRPGIRVLDLFLPGGAALLDYFPYTLFPNLVASNQVDPYFKSLGSVTVPGKQLAVTQRFQDVIPALQNSAASLVVGLGSGTPAHEFGIPFATTGNHEFVSVDTPTSTLTTTLGALSGRPMPAHMVFNLPPRLGKFGSTPYLAGTSSEAFALSYGNDPNSASFKGMAEAANLATALDNGYLARLSHDRRETLRSWYLAMTATRADLGSNRYSQLLSSAAEVNRYASALSAVEAGSAGIFPTAIKAFQFDFTNFISLGIPGSWDSHSSQALAASVNVPKVGKILAMLCADLASTPDPAVSGKSLADTTVIRLTTEFTRESLLNPTAGTGHGRWSWALLIGPASFLEDNLIVGGIDANHDALGWDGSQARPLANDTQIDHGHMVCAMYKFMGVDLTLVPQLPTTLRLQFAAAAQRIGVFKNG